MYRIDVDWLISPQVSKQVSSNNGRLPVILLRESSGHRPPGKPIVLRTKSPKMRIGDEWFRADVKQQTRNTECIG